MTRSHESKEEKELTDEQHDAETIKQREWDEFTEANARGSGNRMNRG